MDDNNEAWIALKTQYSSYLLFWLHRHIKSQEALRLEPAQNYVDEALERLWKWGFNQRNGVAQAEESTFQVEFTSLAGALAFLKRCMNSLIWDKLRVDERNRVLPFPEDDPATTSTLEDYLSKKEFWHVIETILVNAREQRVIFLLYQQGLKPRQILEHCPGEFADVNEIYRLTRNARDRLFRHGDVIRYKTE